MVKLAAPLVAIPARFSASASALRYQAIVTARALSEAVLRAGGEPLTVHPRGASVADRLAFADAVLLPGGGDLDPMRYGQPVASDAVYDVDTEQDEFDLAVARWALDAGLPLLAVCRGLQVVNVALGGTLDQHMASDHRNAVHDVCVTADSAAAAVLGEALRVSCYHHQRIASLSPQLRAVAYADDGTIEAVEMPGAGGWFLGVQWHPEDTVADDPVQQGIFAALVEAAAVRRRVTDSLIE